VLLVPYPVNCNEEAEDVNPPQLIEAVRQVKSRDLAAPQALAEISAALAAFVGDARNQPAALPDTTRGLYTRILLNSPYDDFQIVVVVWGPHSGSPVHDHSDTVGAVAALRGATRETKYELAQRDGDRAQLRRSTVVQLVDGFVTPILPDEALQIHDMVNDTGDWTATVHVYLTPIDHFRTYEPESADWFRAQPRELWFDVEDGWRRWATAIGATATVAASGTTT